MGKALQILNQYELQGNRLAHEVNPDNANWLSDRLLERLAVEPKVLNFSPASLRRLETVLLEYAQRQEQSSTPLNNWPERDILAIIREIAAYVGLTLMRNLGGRWEQDSNALMGPSYRVDGPFKITKDGQTYYSSGLSYALGSDGASCIDLIFEGKKPIIYSTYISAKRKSAREKL